MYVCVTVLCKRVRDLKTGLKLFNFIDFRFYFIKFFSNIENSVPIMNVIYYNSVDDKLTQCRSILFYLLFIYLLTVHM